LRAELEKEKRKLQAEIAELQDQLHQARAKVSLLAPVRHNITITHEFVYG